MKKIVANYYKKGKYYIYKKIMQFPTCEDIISDDDIISLFLGLVRLIKKSTEIKIEEKYEKEIFKLKKELDYIKRN